MRHELEGWVEWLTEAPTGSAALARLVQRLVAAGVCRSAAVYIRASGGTAWTPLVELDADGELFAPAQLLPHPAAPLPGAFPADRLLTCLPVLGGELFVQLAGWEAARLDEDELEGLVCLATCCPIGEAVPGLDQVPAPLPLQEATGSEAAGPPSEPERASLLQVQIKELLQQGVGALDPELGQALERALAEPSARRGPGSTSG